MKLRLGNLVFLVGWENLGLSEIEHRLIHLKKRLDTKLSNAEYQNKGHIALIQKTQSNKRKKESVRQITADEWRELNHQKITIGGLFVKHKMEKIDRATLFGALLDQSQNP